MVRSSRVILASLMFAVLTASLQAAPDIRYVLSSITLSFANDGRADRALLVQNENSRADLYIYRDVSFEAVDPRDAKPSFVKTNVVFSGGWGQQPVLSLNDKGSLVVKSMNDAIGRSRWEQKLTIAIRSDEFVVAGIAYTSRDTLDPNAGGGCDINLLSGKGLRDGKPIEDEKFKPIKLRDWTNEKLPKSCAF